MNQIAAVPKDDREEINKVVSLADEFKNMEVKTKEDAEFAALSLVDAKNSVKILEEKRKGITVPINESLKRINAMFKPAKDALIELEQALKPKISAYYEKVEAEQRKAEAEALEKARKEQEKLGKRAEQALEKGQEEKAEALQAQAATVVAKVPVKQYKIKGVSVSKRWTAEVTDVKAVCQAIANGDLPPTILEFKQAELNKIASTWQDTKAFEGLKIYQARSAASRK